MFARGSCRWPLSRESRRWPFALFVYSFLLDLVLEAWVLESGTLNLRPSRQTRAKWSLPPLVEQVFPLAGHTFQGWAPRRSPHVKHVPGSLRSFIWLCLRPVQWTSSSVPFDESTINLFVCLETLWLSLLPPHLEGFS